MKLKELDKDVISYKSIKCLGVKSSINEAGDTIFLSYRGFHSYSE